MQLRRDLGPFPSNTGALGLNLTNDFTLASLVERGNVAMNPGLYRILSQISSDHDRC